MKKRSKILISITAVIIAITLLCLAYLSSYLEANITDHAFLTGNYTSDRIRPHKLEKHIVLTKDEAEIGLIFYPGGKIEDDSYIPLMTACADKNIFCAIAEMPFNLAIFNKNAADEIISLYPDIDKWYIAGHSLGGTMAVEYAKENSDKIEGLILLGSYTTTDISKTDIDVLSIYGNEDKIIGDKYSKYQNNLPENVTEFVIDGGCHAFFGVYGVQKGDGIPKITNEEQIKITANEIIKFISD